MQDDVSEMMSPGFFAEELAIQHMGNSSEWMPVRCVDMSKCPPDAIKRQAASDVRIIVNVIPVVVTNEPVS